MDIFLGEPPADIKQWIIEHSTPPAPAGHADTWYKYQGDTEWRTVSISGTIEGDSDYVPTLQIPNSGAITDLEIGTDVTELGYYAFTTCEISNLVIPNSVTCVGPYSFSNCNNLTAVTVGSDVKTIGDTAFYSCINLANVTIPNSVTSIEDSAFGDCPNLTGVTIGSGINTIGNGVFYGCSKLSNIIIPSSVQNIGHFVFGECNALTSVTFIGKSLSEIEEMPQYPWGISDTSIIHVA